MARAKMKRNGTSTRQHAAACAPSAIHAQFEKIRNQTAEKQDGGGYREFWPEFSASYPDTPTKGC